MDKYRCNWRERGDFKYYYLCMEVNSSIQNYLITHTSLMVSYWKKNISLDLTHTDPMQLSDCKIIIQGTEWYNPGRRRRVLFQTGSDRPRPGQETGDIIEYKTSWRFSMHLICCDFSVGLWRTLLDTNVTGLYCEQSVLLPLQVACCKVSPGQGKMKLDGVNDR